MAGESGKIDPMYQFQIEPLAQLNIAGYDVSFTNSSLFMILVLGALWLFMWGGMKRELVPGRWQMAVETMTGFIDDMLEANIGKAGRKYVPYIFTLFMFILFGNLLGLVPVGVIPGVHAFTFTSHFTVTGVLAILSFSIVLVVGFWLWPSYLPLASQVLIAGLFALSFDLVLGYAGIVSLGHAAYFGVGAYAEKKLRETVEEYFPDKAFKIGKILHPSPASPIANRGWEPQAERQLLELGVWQ